MYFKNVDLQESASDSDAPVDAPFGKTTSRVKEAIEFQFTRNYMLQSSTDEDFKKAME